MSDILNKYDYKRIEELLDEMVKEQQELYFKTEHSSVKSSCQFNVDTIRNTQFLIKNRQTLKDTNGSTSTEDRGNNEPVPER